MKPQYGTALMALSGWVLIVSAAFMLATWLGWAVLGAVLIFVASIISEAA